MHCSKQKDFSKIICHCLQLRGSKFSSIGGLLESLQLSTWLPNSLLVCTKLQVFPTPLKSSSLTTVTQWIIQICDGRFAFVSGCHSLSVRFFPCGSGFGVRWENPTSTGKPAEQIFFSLSCILRTVVLPLCLWVYNQQLSSPLFICHCEDPVSVPLCQEKKPVPLCSLTRCKLQGKDNAEQRCGKCSK